jgi:hypothetical protein
MLLKLSASAAAQPDRLPPHLKFEIYAYVRASLRAAYVFAEASLGPLPVQVITLLNSEPVRRNESGRYATMFFAEFDSSE